MTKYIEAVAGTQVTVRVDYIDPAGAFGGWFIHSIHHLDDASPSVPTFPKNTADSIGAVSLRESINDRLAKMHGCAGCVTYTMTAVQSIKPAVVDTDF
jgi:hypothetical protein